MNTNHKSSARIYCRRVAVIRTVGRWSTKDFNHFFRGWEKYLFNGVRNILENSYRTNPPRYPELKMAGPLLLIRLPKIFFVSWRSMSEIKKLLKGVYTPINPCNTKCELKCLQITSSTTTKVWVLCCLYTYFRGTLQTFPFYCLFFELWISLKKFWTSFILILKYV